MSGHHVTLQDVAREAGVSVSTVSRALSRDGEGLKPATTQRVRDAASRLGYRHDTRARALRTGSSDVIGILAAHMGGWVAAHLVDQITTRLLDRGMRGTLHSAARDPERELELVDEMLSARVAGIIVVSHFSPNLGEALESAARQGIPVLYLDPPAPPYADAVTIDFRSGMRLAVRHLIDLGHRRIGLIQIEPIVPSIEDRVEGYRAEMATAGVTPQDDWIQRCEGSERGGAEAIQQLLSRCPEITAVACVADTPAYGALHAAREIGRAIPDSLSITGFDDLPQSEFTSPPLTTVRADADVIVEEGVDVLLRRINQQGGDPHVAQKAGELVIRTSTAAPADEDTWR